MWIVLKMLCVRENNEKQQQRKKKQQTKKEIKKRFTMNFNNTQQYTKRMTSKWIFAVLYSRLLTHTRTPQNDIISATTNTPGYVIGLWSQIRKKKYDRLRHYM